MRLLSKQVNELIPWVPGMASNMPMVDSRVESGLDESMYIPQDRTKNGMLETVPKSSSLRPDCQRVETKVQSWSGSAKYLVDLEDIKSQFETDRRGKVFC